MKTLKLITLIALASVAFSSCSDNGPTSINDRDANTVLSTAELDKSITLSTTPLFSVPLQESHVGTVNSEFGEVGTCPTPPEGQEGWFGWHFVMPGSNFTALSVTFENAGTFTANPFPDDVFISHPHNSHAYIWTQTNDKLLGGSAESDGDNTFFVLSHVCPGDNEPLLKVTKTVETSYTRTHEWSIEKKVETENEYELDDYPKIWLKTDGSLDEKATWTVDVKYEGYEDSKYNVSGEITIENIGSVDATITSIVDKLGGYEITIDCGEEPDYTLSVGEELICTYDEDGYVEGVNVVKVTVDGVEDPFEDTKPILWGDPTTEVNETVNIKDISDLFGEKNLGTVTAPDGDTFTYKKYFKWSDYGADNCGNFTYDNTATIDIEGGDSADATLKVNVQCFNYETAYALGDNGECFIPTFSNWGWTNPMEPGEETWELWAGAAHCDTEKGKLVGSANVLYGDEDPKNIVVTFDVGNNYLKETHVYAGYDKFPKDHRGRETVAPGQYVNNSPFDGSKVYVIAHGVVGFPDPDFGPTD